jgi:helicase MOV-10
MMLDQLCGSVQGCVVIYSCAIAGILQVPGLAEARPSVLRGDALYVSHAGGSGGGKEWQGIVHNVNRDQVRLCRTLRRSHSAGWVHC